MKVEQINELIQISKKEEKINIKEVSDGHHTFQELYNQITILWAIMCNTHPTLSWKSKKHDDEENNPMFNGDFNCRYQYYKWYSYKTYQVRILGFIFYTRIRTCPAL